jgi:hypothetical protein
MGAGFSDQVRNSALKTAGAKSLTSAAYMKRSGGGVGGERDLYSLALFFPVTIKEI